MTDGTCLFTVLNEIKTSSSEIIEIYNLAAHSHVKISFEMPEYTANADAFGTLKLIDPKYFRPCEVDMLIGDLNKAKKHLGWTAQTTFKKIVEEMVGSDCSI